MPGHLSIGRLCPTPSRVGQYYKGFAPINYPPRACAAGVKDRLCPSVVVVVVVAATKIASSSVLGIDGVGG